MAIRSTAMLSTMRLEAVSLPCDSRQEARTARKAARRFVSLLGKLDRPRYEHEGGWADEEADATPDVVVLVFVDEPPVEMGTPAFECLPPAEDLMPRTDATPLGLPMMPDPDNGGRLSPILSEEDCALAAYRRLLSEAIEYGPVQTWHVTTVNPETGAWERRAYKGTESALRRNFPDGHEATRMEAAGMLGVPNWVTNGDGETKKTLGKRAVPEGLTDIHGNPTTIHEAQYLDGYDGPTMPYRIQKKTP